ncbi:hypothetical protein [Treponema sp.]|nr:hypothetical protein [Treponema sp.]
MKVKSLMKAGTLFLLALFMAVFTACTGEDKSEPEGSDEKQSMY